MTKPQTIQYTAYDAGLLQGKAYRVLATHLTKALLPFHLSIPEWKLLGKLSEQPNMKPARLAEVLGVEPPLITSLVAGLEKKKLLRRVDDKNDKRAKVITSTKKGLELVEAIEPVVRAEMRDLLKGTTYDELLAYLKILSAIVTNG